tara:strand:+ start:292 stop:1041 length:750 start_codon:yes stop_codon:yes gene_type:complete
MTSTTIDKLNIPQFSSNSKEATNFFNNFGFHIEEDVLNDAECKEAIKNSFSLPNYLDGSLIPNQMPQNHNDYYLLLMKNKNIRKINNNLISKNKKIFGLQSTFFFGPSGSTGASKHQDSLYVQPEDAEGFITSWLSLVDMFDDNMGNLVVYPETHKKGQLEIKERKNIKNSNFQLPSLVKYENDIDKNSKKIIIKLKKGTVVSLHSNVVHGSLDNTSNTQRYSMIFTYIRDECKFIEGRKAKRKKINLD